EVGEGGAAARGGLRAGGVLRAVNRVAVNTLHGLEQLLLQNGPGTVRLHLDAGGEVTLPAP
ncbi:MAG TPA: PDZ domain-containing protein, partial [Gemmatimonadaceae bacterium]|nr:PDZ domain-containing protein [Gemmatimonadaceae bacterium]